MTSAARPTWLPAMGGHSLRDRGNAPLHQKAARDLQAHTKLKLRQVGQNAPQELNRDELRDKLESKERDHFDKKGRPRDEDAEDEDAKRRKLLENNELDKDDSDEEDNAVDEDDSDSDSDSDEEDDTAELLRELEKIKRERAEEKERLEAERQQEEERQREEEALTGNPLLQGQSGPKDFAVKRRWDDDVIFKNQAKGVDENPKKRFINDMLRSDFHRKFMSKYVK
ncbi:hypothetical protein HK097_010510 [Rhizophlyctis rosea]|uniref:Cwf15/Cwc15 cell cycle control protein n=1 Tax=Rhizophlyctis rosea TaxID=64517 RepID=A0AAD5S8Z9_9FUNG|nr:hypothetical protein HK097_010510 [Rhizophlyctis rosea]